MKSLDLDPGQVGATVPRTTRLGDLLLKSDLITKEQLDEALKYQKTRGGSMNETGTVVKGVHSPKSAEEQEQDSSEVQSLFTKTSAAGN